MVGAIIVRISYGYRVDHAAQPDALVELADKVVVEFLESIRPGAWLVDTIPMRKRYPVHISELPIYDCPLSLSERVSAVPSCLVPWCRVPAYGE